jgi:hypothetical protein
MLLLVAALLVCPAGLALENKTIRIDITLPDEVMLGLTYNTLFKVTNLNYSRNFDSHVNVTVYYNLSKNGVLVYESNFSKVINSFSTSSNGFLFFNEIGSFTLCGSSALADTVCRQVVVINPLEVGCQVSVNLSIPKSVFSNNEQVEITNVISMQPQDDYPFIIEYWVEDLFGEVVKKKLNTSNDNDKVFTPQIKDKVGVFVAKNKLTYVGCNNTISGTESSFLFVVRNQDYVEKKLEEDVSNASSYVKGKITSFYTRTKNFNESINLYANVKTLEGGYVLLSGNDVDEVVRLDASTSSQKLSFNVKARPGENKFYLELFEKGESVEKKSVVFSLKEAEKKLPKNATVKKQASNTSKTTAAKPTLTSKVSLNKTTTNVLQDNLLNIHNATENHETGLVVYEVENPKVNQFLPIASAIFLGIVGVGLVFGKTAVKFK